MPGQPGPSPQVRPPGMPGSGIPGPATSGSPASMANMTPQQRAAHIANAQAAAGRITPLMATHDPGLMASMMGPGSMPNGNVARPSPQHAHGGPGQQLQQQQQQQQPGQPGQQGPPGVFQQPQQPQGPARPPSAQGGVEDPHTSHFSSVQMGSSPANMQRPGMQRAASQLGNNPGGMGPPGTASISSPSPRISAMNLQQQQQSGNNNTANQAQAQGESPAPSNVPNTPKLGSAEKGKKGNARQRKNSKATAKTPVLTAASVPAANTNASSSAAPTGSNGIAGPSTPAAANAATPVSANATTPGRDAIAKPEGAGGASAGGPQPSSQPVDAAMPPPAGPSANSSDANAFGGINGPDNAVSANGTSNLDGSSSSSSSSNNNPNNNNNNNNSGGGGGGVEANGTGAGGTGGAEDFSMFGFGGSMNDIFDFELSTDGAGGGGLGGDGWDSNFGNLFGSVTGGQDGS